jgi:hypothetical protein
MRLQARPPLVALLVIALPASTTISHWQTGLWINRSASTTSCLHQVWILFNQNAVVLLCFPVPDTVRREYEVHLFERTLVRFWVQRPNDDDAEDIDTAKDVQSVFAQTCEDGGQEKDTPAVSDGPANHTPSITLGSNLEWEDLSRI